VKAGKNTIKIMLFVAIVILFFAACAPETEIKPPETKIEKIQPIYGSTGIHIVLSGTDDKTPSDKLTYEYFIYSKANDEEVLKCTEKIQDHLITCPSEKLGEGSYLIRAFAINEFGIKDNSPAEATFRIDLTAPREPAISYQLKSGQVHFSCLEEDGSDIAGYEMELSDSKAAKAFSSTEEDFTFNAEKGERYLLKIKAIDFAGNASAEKAFVIDTDVDDAPVVESELPNLLGSNDTKMNFVLYDDWDEADLITCEATFGNIPLKLNDQFLNLDLSTFTEGTHTLLISLMDTNEHLKEIRKDIYVDLTPPDTPEIVGIRETDKTYILSWKDVSTENSTFRVYGFNRQDDRVRLADTEMDSFRTEERFLHYVVSAVDQAGNESSTSYPLRTYNEKYVPITSSEIGLIEENTLLTSLYSPYRINSEIVIPKDLMLGIEKGVEIIFEDGGLLTVKGQLLSIPSNSEKKRVIRTDFSEENQRTENLIDISGGSVWLNDYDVFGDSHTDFFIIESGGELRAQRLTVDGFDRFINAVDAEIIFMEDAGIQTNVFATGTDCTAVKLKKVKIDSEAGIRILNIKNLEIDQCHIESDTFAVQLDGFSNAILNDSTFSADHAVIMDKLSAADAKNVELKGLSSALTLNGASAINLRNSILSASQTAVYVDRSAYLCAIESTVTNSNIGICTMNSDIVLKDINITKNVTGISSNHERLKKSENIVFKENQDDMRSTEER